MHREEFFALDAVDAAAFLTERLAEGMTEAQAIEAAGVTKAELMKAQIFCVKGKFIARAWAGYTSTKRTGNEAGDTGIGVGDSDPSKGYKGV